MSRIRVLAVVVLGLSAACSAGAPTEPAATAPPASAVQDADVCNGGMMGSSGKC